MNEKKEFLKAAIRRVMSTCENPISDTVEILGDAWDELIDELEAELKKKPNLKLV